MTDDASTDGMLPLRAQRVLAVTVAAALTGMAVGYVALGGFTGGLVPYDAPPAPSARFTVNVNDAGVDELAVLPGLGPALAARIVEHRRDHGRFESLDDLLHVPGIGPATLEEMRPHLRPIRRRSTAP